MKQGTKTGDCIVTGHGSGGLLSRRLITGRILPAWRNPILEQLGDAAVCSLDGTRLAFTTDSYVVTPLFFPGGDIGRLAVCGTVNDLAMSGAEPRWLSCGFILEEGLQLDVLDRIIASMHNAAQEAGVEIVTGDTKVVPRGHVDRMFINTAGIGLIPDGLHLGPEQIRPGDAILINGPVGDHGVAVMLEREGLPIRSTVCSDAAPLNGLTADLKKAQVRLRLLRDPTRGGLAVALHETAESSRLGIFLQENAIPVRPAVTSACELLGLDPLYVANEGKCIVIVHPEDAGRALSVLQAHPLGHGATVIGEVASRHPGMVILKTAIGGERALDVPAGEILPRIC